MEAGNLKVLIPIGMEVQNYLTRKRLEETLDGKAELADAIPAPNSWATAGYDKLSLCTEIGQYTEGEVKIKALIFLDYPIISISR